MKNKLIPSLIFLLIGLFLIISFLIVYNGGMLVHSLTGNVISIHANIIGVGETEIKIDNPSLENKLVIPISIFIILVGLAILIAVLRFNKRKRKKK